MSNEDKKRLIRLNVPINLDLNNRLNETAAEMGITKAGLVRVILNDYYKQLDSIEILKDFDIMSELKKLVKEKEQQ